VSTSLKTSVPSAEHEAITRLFRDGPDLAADLLADVLHLPLPEHGEPTVGPGDIRAEDLLG
jgi:hypothetical protein